MHNFLPKPAVKPEPPPAPPQQRQQYAPLKVFMFTANHTPERALRDRVETLETQVRQLQQLVEQFILGDGK